MERTRDTNNALHFQIRPVMFELYEDGLLPETQWHNIRKDIFGVEAAYDMTKICGAP